MASFEKEMSVMCIQLTHNQFVSYTALFSMTFDNHLADSLKLKSENSNDSFG